MKEYFELQLIMTNRKIKEIGMPPVMGYALGVVIFILLSEYIFTQIKFAKYIIILACIASLFRLFEKRRTDFLISTFGDKSKNKIRVLENLIVAIPFVLVLVFKFLYAEALLLFLFAISSAYISFSTAQHFIIPTPFSKKPFEFTVGFRTTFLMLPLAYGLAVISIQVGNFNLGIFSMVLIPLVTLTYYIVPEEATYVWIYADSPKSFLNKKIMQATKNATLLTLPISLGLFIFNPTQYDIILLFVIISILLLWTMVLAKYAAFPSEINLSEGIMVAFALSFPPLIIVLIPYFYKKSIQTLQLLLDD